MNRADFTVLVSTIKGTLDRSAELYQKYKIDLMDYEEDYSHVISLLGQSLFGGAGWDWVEYFIYEDNHKVYDADKNEIPFSTIDEVYDFLIKEGYVKEVLNADESLVNDKK
jgi:hypothetical protein